MLLPNYGVFDERRYFEPGDTPGADRGRRGAGRADDLRGHLVPGPARVARGARRREPDRQPLRLALPPRQGQPSASRWSRSRARETGRGVRALQPGRRPGRARLRRPQRDRRRAAARRSRARAQFDEELLRLRPRAARAGGRLRTRGTGRRSTPAGTRRRPCSPGSTPAAARRASEPQLAEPLEPEAEVYEALVLGLRDYVDKNGFERVAGRALGRDRLGAGRPGRRRRARPGARELRRHALPALQRRDAGRRAGDRRATSAPS